MNYLRKKCSIIIFSFFCISINAQPYLYTAGPLVDSLESTDYRNWSYNINRTNLQNGEEELFLYNGGNFIWLTTDQTQSWLIVDNYYDTSDLYSCLDTLDHFKLPEGVDAGNHPFLYSKTNQSIYLVNTIDEEIKIFKINVQTKLIEESVDQIPPLSNNDGSSMFFSKDEDIIYIPVVDTVTKQEQILTYSISLNRILSVTNIAQYGYPEADGYILHRGNAGVSVIESYFNKGKKENYFRIYNFDTDSGSSFIHYDGFAVPYLIRNKEYLIVARTLYDTGEYKIYFSGEINIYNTKTAGLIKKFDLTPKGKIYTFDNYSDNFYYVEDLETEPQVFKVNIDSILAEEQGTGLNIKLTNSQGTLLTGGTLQYYEGSWKDAVNNGDGTFKVVTSLANVSLRMTYEYGTQTVSNVPAQNNSYTFQTVNAQVQLQNSQRNPIDTGRVQYYAGDWRDFGITSNGVASKELLPGNYSFRMTYAFASKDKQQDLNTNPTVVFQTVNAAVELRSSEGALIDRGTVQYYSGAWREFETTINGAANKELLPNNYSFRMNYAFASNDKQQDINLNPMVVFQTINAAVELRNSAGNLIDQGIVQYYSGAWRAFGTTENGVANKELLPNNYTFRMNFEYMSNDKVMDISINNVISFNTVLCTIRVKDSVNQPLDNIQASYYSGAWRTIGNTVEGEITKELLPANLTFRIIYDNLHQDKVQNLSMNNIVEFSLP